MQENLLYSSHNQNLTDDGLHRLPWDFLHIAVSSCAD